MHRPNFCVECGERIARKGWRPFARPLCPSCAQRLGKSYLTRAMLAIAFIALAAFLIGKLWRPAAPPLVIQRAANSPLYGAPANANVTLSNNANDRGNANQTVAADDAVYICGARTKKGTPCHRRVHFAGERCFQHKGMIALLPIEKLTIKP